MLFALTNGMFKCLILCLKQALLNQLLKLKSGQLFNIIVDTVEPFLTETFLLLIDVTSRHLASLVLQTVHRRKTSQVRTFPAIGHFYIMDTTLL